jgi:lipoate-protein ligase A
MAVDESILHAVAEGKAAPTMRLYAWDPACLSLGRAQPIEDVNLERLEQTGFDLVRRPTGGRAILHDQELTYALIAPEDHPLMTGGVLESYRRISAGLIAALEQLAVHVEVRGPEPVQGDERVNPICFEVPSPYEITVRGKKILGSAQVRKRHTVLQHGSLPLTGDIAAICEILTYRDDDQRARARQQVRERAVALADVTERELYWEQVAKAFIDAFEQVLEFEFEESDLTAQEVQTINRLLAERYENMQWIQRIRDEY